MALPEACTGRPEFRRATSFLAQQTEVRRSQAQRSRGAARRRARYESRERPAGGRLGPRESAKTEPQPQGSNPAPRDARTPPMRHQRKSGPDPRTNWRQSSGVVGEVVATTRHQETASDSHGHSSGLCFTLPPRASAFVRTYHLAAPNNANCRSRTATTGSTQGQPSPRATSRAIATASSGDITQPTQCGFPPDPR